MVEWYGVLIFVSVRDRGFDRFQLTGRFDLGGNGRVSAGELTYKVIFPLIVLIDRLFICVCVVNWYVSFVCVWLVALFGIDVVCRVHTCIDALSIWAVRFRG
jgi:hypothetical protein